MKFRHIALSALAAASIGSAHAALPSVTPNLGLDPVAAPVAGFAMFGSGITSYSFTLSTLSSLSGSLFGFGTISLNSILVDSTPTLLGSGGTFNVSGLSAGAHTLTFNYSSPTIGGFAGTVSTSPVPEAGAIAMALVGAGVVGFAARRRKAD